jgi:ribosomal protein S3AE
MAAASKSDLSNGHVVQAPSSVERDLSSLEFQPDTIKQASNTGMHKLQICIVNHDHIALITWFGTHIIARRLKRSNLKKRSLKLKIQLLVLTKDFTKQFVLVAKSIFKFRDSQRMTLRR